MTTTSSPRYEMTWRGYSESDFLVVDTRTNRVVDIFNPYVIHDARKQAEARAAQLNAMPCDTCRATGFVTIDGEQKRCVDCP